MYVTPGWCHPGRFSLPLPPSDATVVRFHYMLEYYNPYTQHGCKRRAVWLAHNTHTMKWNESAMIYSAFENRLRAGLEHTMQTNPAVEQNKNIKWSERP